MIYVASSLTALDALCDQPTFRPAWCREHSAAMVTEPSQPLELAREILSRSSCACILAIPLASRGKSRRMSDKSARILVRVRLVDDHRAEVDEDVCVGVRVGVVECLSLIHI